MKPVSLAVSLVLMNVLATANVLADSRTVYGTDDRIDYYAAPAALQKLADSTVALFKADNIQADGTLNLSNYAKKYDLCKREPFGEQPVGAFCSGSLVAPDIIMTAGHCIRNDSDCANTKFIFGFALKSVRMPHKAQPDDIYSCAGIISRQLDAAGDYALIKLNRPATNRVPLKLNRGANIAEGAHLLVIGHPMGLPVKIAGNASVRDASQPGFFVANLDTYGGNSGSAVFNAETHLVEGILVRGDDDLVGSTEQDTTGQQHPCQISNVNPDDGGRGEDVTKISLVLPFLPAAGAQKARAHDPETIPVAVKLAAPDEGTDSKLLRIMSALDNSR
ncbi:MAG: serine protease [Elusimicrobiales bacterium]|nr:serine protease [Elusimicrobiales bacterium]